MCVCVSLQHEDFGILFQSTCQVNRLGNGNIFGSKLQTKPGFYEDLTVSDPNPVHATIYWSVLINLRDSTKHYHICVYISMCIYSIIYIYTYTYSSRKPTNHRTGTAPIRQLDAPSIWGYPHLWKPPYLVAHATNRKWVNQPWWFQWDFCGGNVHKHNWGELTHLLNLVGGLNPSEKYESQLGWLFPILMGK